MNKTALSSTLNDKAPTKLRPEWVQDQERLKQELKLALKVFILLIISHLLRSWFESTNTPSDAVSISAQTVLPLKGHTQLEIPLKLIAPCSLPCFVGLMDENSSFSLPKVRLVKKLSESSQSEAAPSSIYLVDVPLNDYQQMAMEKKLNRPLVAMPPFTFPKSKPSSHLTKALYEIDY